jgi:hypothetical protein
MFTSSCLYLQDCCHWWECCRRWIHHDRKLRVWFHRLSVQSGQGYVTITCLMHVTLACSFYLFVACLVVISDYILSLTDISPHHCFVHVTRGLTGCYSAYITWPVLADSPLEYEVCARICPFQSLALLSFVYDNISFSASTERHLFIHQWSSLLLLLQRLFPLFFLYAWCVHGTVYYCIMRMSRPRLCPRQTPWLHATRCSSAHMGTMSTTLSATRRSLRISRFVFPSPIWVCRAVNHPEVFWEKRDRGETETGRLKSVTIPSV